MRTFIGARFGSSTPIAQLLDSGLMAVYLACALVMVSFTIAITHRGRIGWNDASFGALVGAFPNTGFMGVPLLVALLGALGLLPGSLGCGRASRSKTFAPAKAGALADATLRPSPENKISTSCA